MLEQMRTAIVSAVMTVAGLSAAFGQETCINPETSAADNVATEIWRDHNARRDTSLMTEIAGTWFGEMANPDGTKNRITVTYDQNGTLTFVFRECRKGSDIDCVETPGQGTWAAFRIAASSISMARRLSTRELAHFCDHSAGVLKDRETFVGSDGQIGRRLR